MIVREMEAMVEIEAMLEKIWDIHDKLSDAIHTITRSHFLNCLNNKSRSAPTLYTNDFHASDHHDDDAISEARSLTAIRSALENLEDQIEFFCTFKSQQWAERAAAIARLERSRNLLAKRLADHHGKKSKVIEEALTFVGNVKDASHFAVPETMLDIRQKQKQYAEELVDNGRKRPNFLVQAFVSTLTSAKKCLKWEHMGSVLAHAGLIAFGMLAFLHLHQAAFKDDFVVQASHPLDDSSHRKRGVNNVPSGPYLNHLDVLLGRG